jgi:competence protein ComFC
VEIVASAQSIWTGLQALFFPDRCASCDQLGVLFCDECQRKVALVFPPLCPLCGCPSTYGRLCRRCRESPLAIDGIRSVAFFEGPLRPAVHAFKYDGIRRLAAPLAELMIAHWHKRPLPADAVVPVPLHRSRLRKRGYNQAALLAHLLGAGIGLPVNEDWLVRTKATLSQVELDASERKANVANAFQCQNRDAVAGRRVLLIDDVYTTGATLESCSLALRQAGAQSVWAFTLGRRR